MAQFTQKPAAGMVFTGIVEKPAMPNTGMAAGLAIYLRFQFSNMASTHIQFMAHASFRVTTPEGAVILVDPWINGNPFLPEHCRQQPRIDLVLVTHGHEDHFDNQLPQLLQASGAKLAANPICRWRLIEQGLDTACIEAMNLGGTIQVAGVRVSMVNALHLSHFNTSATSITHPHPAVGFVVRLSDGVSIYFAGDTAVFGDMALIADIYQPTIAVLPVGDRFTMGPEEAAAAIQLLRVHHVIPCHYGTFPPLTGTPGALRALCAAHRHVHIHALQPGETLDTGTLL